MIKLGPDVQVTLGQFVGINGILLMLIGGLGMALMGKQNRAAIAVFMLGSAATLFSAFMEKPEFIGWAQISIGRALIGLIGTIIGVIRIRMMKSSRRS